MVHELLKETSDMIWSVITPYIGLGQPFLLALSFTDMVAYIILIFPAK